MVVTVCPSCGGKYAGYYNKSSVKTADGILSFSCETCQGRGRVERKPDGQILAIPDVMDAVQDSRNSFFVSHPEIFTERRK
jgi:hypothetical protein